MKGGVLIFDSRHHYLHIVLQHCRKNRHAPSKASTVRRDLAQPNDACGNFALGVLPSWVLYIRLSEQLQPDSGLDLWEASGMQPAGTRHDSKAVAK